MGENVTFDLSVSTLKAGISTKKVVENGKNDQFVDEIKTKSRPRFLWQPNAKIGVLWVTAETISKIWGHWVTAALKIGGLWSLTSTLPP